MEGTGQYSTSLPAPALSQVEAAEFYTVEDVDVLVGVYGIEDVVAVKSWLNNLHPGSTYQAVAMFRRWDAPVLEALAAWMTEGDASRMWVRALAYASTYTCVDDMLARNPHTPRGV